MKPDFCFVQRDVLDPPTYSQCYLCKLQPGGESRLKLVLHGITRMPANRGTDVNEGKSNNHNDNNNETLSAKL